LAIEDFNLSESLGVLFKVLVGGDELESIVNNKHLVRHVYSILGHNFTSRLLGEVASSIRDGLSGKDGQRLLGKGTEEIGDGGSDDGLVVDGVSLNSASSEGVADLVGHGRVESKDQVSVLEDLGGSTSEVSGHLSEGIVD